VRTSPDTSVVVAGLCSWHPDHDEARAALAAMAAPIAHVLVESYSVLTRLPAGRRITPTVAHEAIVRALGGPPVGLTPLETTAFVTRVSELGIAGGAVYDALVAETARRAGLAISSLDRRAKSTYEVIGVEVEWLDSLRGG
jgi:predicted nucleic acid-binding protein